jgi:hypothetical protein
LTTPHSSLLTPHHRFGPRTLRRAQSGQRAGGPAEVIRWYINSPRKKSGGKSVDLARALRSTLSGRSVTRIPTFGQAVYPCRLRLDVSTTISGTRACTPTPTSTSTPPGCPPDPKRPPPHRPLPHRPPRSTPRLFPQITSQKHNHNPSRSPSNSTPSSGTSNKCSKTLYRTNQDWSRPTPRLR